MPEIIIKKHTYKITLSRNSFSRRAIQYHNSILEKFKKIGIVEHEIEISEEKSPIRKAPASASWWVKDDHCNFSYNKMNKYVDNLLLVSKVIDHHINMILEKEMTIEKFVEIFKEKTDISEQRVEARKFFDLDKDHINLEEINKKYKLLAKTLHPDMETGDVEKFKELNEYHKILKRELD